MATRTYKRDTHYLARGPSLGWTIFFFFFSVRSIIIRFVFVYSGWSFGGALVWPFPASTLTEKLFSVLHCKAGNGIRAYMTQATLLSGQFFFCLVCQFLKKKKKKTFKIVVFT